MFRRLIEVVILGRAKETSHFRGRILMPDMATFDTTHLSASDAEVEGVHVKTGATGWAGNDHDFRSGDINAGHDVTMQKYGRQRTINLRRLLV